MNNENSDAIAIKTLNMIHTKFHGLRTVDNYKPTSTEMFVNELICNAYEDICEECHERLMRIKYGPKQQEKENFFKKIFS